MKIKSKEAVTQFVTVELKVNLTKRAVVFGVLITL